MYTRPNYETARQEGGFSCHAAGCQGALREITGTPIRDFNLDIPTCVDCYRRGRPLFAEMFGPEVGLPGIATPAVSYGHPNCLGAELLFPEGGEVAHTHLYGSLEEAVAGLQRPVTWQDKGMAPFYLHFQEELKQAFPGEPVSLGFGAEGPLTTAYELRGDGFFIDLYDNPQLTQEFLRLVVQSIVDFDAFYARANDRPLVNPVGGGMCDDIASFIAPHLFPTFVLPYWEQLFEATTTGTRSAHVEDLRVEQLPFLEDISLSSFDPSISPRLNPRLLTEHCRVPYLWRLGCFHLREMDLQEVEDFVFMSAADGANGCTCVVAETMCNDRGVSQVHAFLRAGKEAKTLLEAGCSREELRQRVSATGQAKLWDGWCGYLGPESSRGGR